MDLPFDLSMEQIVELVSTYGLKLLSAIVIFYIGKWLARRLSNLVSRMMERSGTDRTLVSFVGSLTYVGLFAFVVIAALAQLGIQTASFVAIVGAAGLAIGLALQGSLSNFAAGVMLILFKPFKVGDYVEAGGTAGTVEEIMIFSTKMTTPDNKTIYIPNGAVYGSTITNYSEKPTRRVDLVFGCGYGDDIQRVKALLHEIVAADDRILKEPAPTVALVELADSSVNFVVRPWVNAADYWGVYFDLHEQVKLRFDAEGLSIPYPQQDVHMHAVNAA